MIGSGNSSSYALKAKSKGLNPNDTEIFWECYSDYCPDFIHINRSNLSISVDGSSTLGKSASGIYVLNIRSEDKVQEIVVLEAFMLGVKYAQNKPANSIRINQPWDVWI